MKKTHYTPDFNIKEIVKTEDGNNIGHYYRNCEEPKYPKTTKVVLTHSLKYFQKNNYIATCNDGQVRVFEDEDEFILHQMGISVHFLSENNINRAFKVETMYEKDIRVSNGSNDRIRLERWQWDKVITANSHPEYFI